MTWCTDVAEALESRDQQSRHDPSSLHASSTARPESGDPRALALVSGIPFRPRARSPHDDVCPGGRAPSTRRRCARSRRVRAQLTPSPARAGTTDRWRRGRRAPRGRRRPLPRRRDGMSFSECNGTHCVAAEVHVVDLAGDLQCAPVGVEGCECLRGASGRSARGPHTAQRWPEDSGPRTRSATSINRRR